MKVIERASLVSKFSDAVARREFGGVVRQYSIRARQETKLDVGGSLSTDYRQGEEGFRSHELL
jgi:hypothetical protein